MEKSHHLRMAAGLLVCVLMAPAGAFNLPQVNLGLTSFMDGAPPAGPGFYYAQYFSYYTADKAPNLGAPEFDLDVWVSLSQLLYQSNTPVLLGGKWGLDVIVPLVWIDSTLPDNSNGLGDLLVGPYLQWDPIMGERGPLFMHRVEFQMIFPTGSYDRDKILNPSSNHFSFNPYWAGTYFFTPRWTASWRLHYLWNSANDSPPRAFELDEIRPGQALHANFATSYEVMPQKLRLGINGYFLEQTTRTRARVPDVGTIRLPEDESVFAIGPGALLSFSQDTHLFFNAYFETDSDWRPEGNRFVLRLVHHF
jgi:hypothetical protein